MNQVATTEIEGQLVETTNQTGLMLSEANMARIEALAIRMAESKVTIPEHLRENVGDCFAVIMQAVQWDMNPFVVAQKTHVVSGKLGYEAQLVNAVVQSSGMIEGTFHYKFRGDGEKLQCRVGAVLRGQGEVTWGEWLTLEDVKVRNSPLWKTNPKQQMGYLQVKNWSRLYCPGAILGVYTVDELRDSAGEREIGPGAQAQTSDLNSALAGKSEPAEDITDAEVIEGEPASEPTEEVTYAMVADQLNKADTPQALTDALEAMKAFCNEGDNDQFKEELGGLYRARLAELREKAGQDDE